MDKNKLLFGLVIVLAMLVGFQSWTLSKTKNEVKELKQSISKARAQELAVQSARQAPVLTDPWDTMNQDAWFTHKANEWDPFEEMERMHQAMNHMFRSSLSRALTQAGSHVAGTSPLDFNPEIDAQETKTHYILKFDLPGMEKDKIDVEVVDHYLKVSGERKTAIEDAKQDGYYRVERSFGSFERTVPLPANANTDDVATEYKDGVLTIKIAKHAEEPAEPKSKKVSVT